MYCLGPGRRQVPISDQHQLVALDSRGAWPVFLICETEMILSHRTLGGRE